MTLVELDTLLFTRTWLDLAKVEEEEKEAAEGRFSPIRAVRTALPDGPLYVLDNERLFGYRRAGIKVAPVLVVCGELAAHAALRADSVLGRHHRGDTLPSAVSPSPVLVDLPDPLAMLLSWESSSPGPVVRPESVSRSSYSCPREYFASFFPFLVAELKAAVEDRLRAPATGSLIRGRLLSPPADLSRGGVVTLDAALPFSEHGTLLLVRHKHGGCVGEVLGTIDSTTSHSVRLSPQLVNSASSFEETAVFVDSLVPCPQLSALMTIRHVCRESVAPVSWGEEVAKVILRPGKAANEPISKLDEVGFRMVDGSAGAGKTQALLFVAKQALQQGQNVLFCGVSKAALASFVCRMQPDPVPQGREAAQEGDAKKKKRVPALIVGDKDKLQERVLISADGCAQFALHPRELAPRLAEYKLVCSTVGDALALVDVGARFDLVLIDDAADSAEWALLGALACCKSRLVIAGNASHIPDPALSAAGGDCGLDGSIFERLSKFLPKAEKLVAPQRPLNLGHDGDRAIDVHGRETLTGAGLHNLEEFELIRFLVKILEDSSKSQGTMLDVLVTSSHLGQLSYITAMHNQQPTSTRVLVASPRDCRGLTADIVVISTVRTDGSGHVHDELRRDWKNLATIRSCARKAVWLVGSVEALRESLFRDMLSELESAKLIFSPLAIERIPASTTEFLLGKIGDFEASMPWNVFISDKASSDLRGQGSSMAHVLLHRYATELAHGRHSGRNLGRVNLREIRLPATPGVDPSAVLDLLQAWELPYSDFVLLWSVGLDTNAEEVSQCVEIWRVCNRRDLSESVACVALLLIQKYSQKELDFCRETTTEHGTRKSITKKKIEVQGCLKELRHEATESEKKTIQSLRKQLIFGKRLAEKLCSPAQQESLRGDRGEVALLRLSPTEKQACLSTSGSLIYGRSGTGKTTVLLMKMGFNIERDSSHRSVFITVSPKLCSFAMEIAGLRPPTKDVLFDVVNQERELFGSVPEKWTDLKDGHFPLFVTFAKLLSMLDAALPDPFFSASKGWEWQRQQSDGAPAASGKRATSRGRRVDFEVFRSQYWEHFNKSMTSKVKDAAVLFSEITSHIKGSVEAVKSEKGFLEREEYLKLAQKRSVGVSSEAIYDLFLSYNSDRSQAGQYDDCDVIHSIYRRLVNEYQKAKRHEPSVFRNFPKISSVMIDEVQDCVPSLLAVLPVFCPEKSGFTFVGDTAQAISAGVSFKFARLKDIIFAEIVKKHASKMPEQICLTENFRCHRGITVLANVITELLLFMFPESIDRMDFETSIVQGPKVVCLRGPKRLDALGRLFAVRADGLNLGAQQVILIRSDQEKRSIPVSLGLVLTIAEAKGCEWSDVIVYNFFTGNPELEAWARMCRLGAKSDEFGDLIERLTAYCTEGCQFTSKKRSASFDVSASLETELKRLYVAATRARKNLIFIEEGGSDNVDTVFQIWHRIGAVDLGCSSNPESDKLFEGIKGLLSSENSAADWLRTGMLMYESKRYADAASCFRAAGNVEKERLARGMCIRAEALSLPKDSPERLDRFSQAAQIFKEIGQMVHAAKCFKKAKLIAEAVDAFIKIPDPESAFQCANRAGKHDLALELLFRYRTPLEAAKYSFDRHRVGKFVELARTRTVGLDILEWLAKRLHQAMQLDQMHGVLALVPDQAHVKFFLVKIGAVDRIAYQEAAVGNFKEAARLLTGVSKHNEAVAFLCQGNHHLEAFKSALRAATAWAVGTSSTPFASETTPPPRPSKETVEALKSPRVAVPASLEPERQVLVDRLFNRLTAARTIPKHNLCARMLQAEQELRMNMERPRSAMELFSSAIRLLQDGLRMVAVFHLCHSGDRVGVAPSEEELESAKRFLTIMEPQQRMVQVTCRSWISVVAGEGNSLIPEVLVMKQACQLLLQYLENCAIAVNKLLDDFVSHEKHDQVLRCRLYGATVLHNASLGLKHFRGCHDAEKLDRFLRGKQDLFGELLAGTSWPIDANTDQLLANSLVPRSAYRESPEVWGFLSEVANRKLSGSGAGTGPGNFIHGMRLIALVDPHLQLPEKEGVDPLTKFHNFSALGRRPRPNPWALSHYGIESLKFIQQPSSKCDLLELISFAEEVAVIAILTARNLRSVLLPLNFVVRYLIGRDGIISEMISKLYFYRKIDHTFLNDMVEILLNFALRAGLSAKKTGHEQVADRLNVLVALLILHQGKFKTPEAFEKLIRAEAEIQPQRTWGFIHEAAGTWGLQHGSLVSEFLNSLNPLMCITTVPGRLPINPRFNILLDSRTTPRDFLRLLLQSVFPNHVAFQIHRPDVTPVPAPAPSASPAPVLEAAGPPEERDGAITEEAHRADQEAATAKSQGKELLSLWTFMIRAALLLIRVRHRAEKSGAIVNPRDRADDIAKRLEWPDDEYTRKYRSTAPNLILRATDSIGDASIFLSTHPTHEDVNQKISDLTEQSSLLEANEETERQHMKRDLEWLNQKLQYIETLIGDLRAQLSSEQPKSK